MSTDTTHPAVVAPKLTSLAALLAVVGTIWYWSAGHPENWSIAPDMNDNSAMKFRIPHSEKVSPI